MRGLGGEDVSGEAVVPVPERETPTIRKNKELREAQRRSSLGMRGKRASSSLGRGEISESKRHHDAGTSMQSRTVLTDVGIPHPTVESATFWKHITPTLPEPIRARHLLAWCAKRALDESVAPTRGPSKAKSKDKAKSEVRTDEGDRLVKEIMEEFMANLGKGLVDTNIFSQPVIQCDYLGGSGLPLTLRTRGLSGPLSRSDHIRRTRRTAK
jgi:kinetochore protein Mis13/DSN1